MLTKRQKELLDYLGAYIEQHGYAPTLEEIGRNFALGSLATVHKHLQNLERKGHIRRLPNRSRALEVTPRDGTRPTVQVPLLGRVAAGEPILSADTIDTRIKIEPGLFHPRADFLFRVQGQSMKDAGILDGDLVGVKQQDTADNGQIVVARVAHRRTGEEELTLKRWFRRRNRITLQPENDAIAPIEIDLAAQDEDSQERPPVTIEGLYVGLIRGARA